jgi:hypothetical protein
VTKRREKQAAAGRGREHEADANPTMRGSGQNASLAHSFAAECEKALMFMLRAIRHSPFATRAVRNPS